MKQVRQAAIVCFNQNHYEYIQTLVEFFLSLEQEVFVFLTPALFRTVHDISGAGTSSVEFIVSGEGEKELTFLTRHRARLAKMDSIVFDEFFDLKDNWRFLFLPLKRSKTWLTIHSANIWFRPELFKSVAGFVKGVIRKLILLRVNNIVVFLEQIREHIFKSTRSHKKLLVLPFSLPIKRTARSSIPHRDSISLVIPGMVDVERRNYDRILDVLATYPETNCPFHLILLGRAKTAGGLAILDRCRLMRERGYSITTYSAFVPTEEFDNTLLAADFIFSDIPQFLTRDGTTEIYGQTKDTGVTYLIAKYSIPALLPMHFVPPKQLESCVLSFGDEDSLKLLLDRILSIDLVRLKDTVRVQTSIFHEEMRSNFLSAFSENRVKE